MLTLVLIVAIYTQQVPQAPTQPQPPPRGARPADTKATAVVRGRVTSAETGGPLRRVRVTIFSPDTPFRRSVTTDRDGRYQFTDLPAGRYQLSAARVGYLTMTYGQRQPLMPGRPLQVAAGEVAQKIDFVMPRMSIVAGRVMDDTGEPIAVSNVFPMQMRFLDGRRQLVPVGQARPTDDIGQFHLALLPGEYYILAVSSEKWTEGESTEQFVYAPTFFPGTTLARDAQPIKVGFGQRVTAIDFALVTGRAANVTGTAFSSRGLALAGESVHITQAFQSPSGNVSPGAAAGKVDADGSFILQDLPPGEYTVQVRKAPDQGGTVEWASSNLIMTGADVEGLKLVALPGYVASGRVVSDTGELPPLPPSRLRVGAQAADVKPTGVAHNPEVSVGDDWTFQLGNLFGRQHFRVLGLWAGWSLKAVIHLGRDVTDTPIQPQGTAELTGIQIVLTNKPTRVSGVVSDDRGQPVDGCTIVFFPPDAALWGAESRFVRTVRPDQTSMFDVKGLPPGDYLAAAIDEFTGGDWTEPEYLEMLRDGATGFTLREGEETRLTLKVKKP